MKQPYSEVTIQRDPVGWKLTGCSDDFLEMTGFTRAELRERFEDRFMKMLSATDAPAADELFACKDGLKPLCPWIFTITCKKDMLPVLLQLLPLEDNADILCVRVHKAAFLGEQITKMSQRIVSLENSIPSGFCQVIFDEHLTVIWHNQYFLDLLGYTEEQFATELSSYATGYIHPDDFPLVLKLLNEAVEQGQQIITLEMRVVRRDGGIMTLLSSLSFTDESVNGIPVLYSIGVDISGQIRARQLEQDAERLRSAMEQASTYILEYDVPKRCLLACDTLKKFFGISGNAGNVPESLLESGRVAPESNDTICALFQRIDQGGERAEDVICLQSESAGGKRWFRFRMTSIYNDVGRPMKAILLLEDITERHQMEMLYREEEKRRVAMTYDMDFSCQLNLTKEMIITANESKFPFFDFKSSYSGRELIRRNADRRVFQDDRAEYLRKLNVNYMLGQFEQGVPEITADFRAMDPDGSHCWTRVIVHIIREPVDGDICAYIYTKNIEAEKGREMELRRHAEQDALTGIYNRYTVELYCDRLLRQQTGGLVAVYMLDLDNFKYLNDTYGHLRGDEMLRQASSCMRKIFGEEALLGRLGGDELIALQPNCPSFEEAETTAQKVCDALRALDAGAGVVTVSAGIAFAPRDGSSFVELYHCSDDALYQAKHAGKNCWAVYSGSSSKTDLPKEQRLPVSREWLLEESSDIIYVCDFFSYSLLYMNQGARSIFGVEGDSYLGRKCYEVLQQKEHPCEFCTNHLLCREHFYSWEFNNPTVGKALLLRDRIVDWYGVPARIEFATDISTMAQRNQDLEKQLEVDHAIISCLRTINCAQSFHTAAEAMLRQLAEFYGADRAFILDFQAQRNLLTPRYDWNKPGIRSILQLIGKDGIQPANRLLGCFQNHENYIYERNSTAGTSGDTGSYQQLLYDAGIAAQWCIPFYINGHPAGILGLDNPTLYKGELKVLETLSYFISEELSRSRLSEKLSYLGYHDSLTGLWNRNRYVEYMNELERSRVQSLGIAVADLNALKDINKLRGHSQGDLVVKRAATLLTECFPGAVVFRLSGDEFVVHSENQDRLTFLDQVKRVSEGAAHLDAHGISVGFAWTDQEIDCQRLTMQATDIMMMQKREYYQNQKEPYQPGKHNHAQLQELMEELRLGHFKMYLQPKAGCGMYLLNGAEALVRYESPEAGLIPPNRFIPTLEQAHLIQYVDLFIFESVCKLLARWKKEGRTLLHISLNFSRQTVLEPDLLQTLLRITERYQAPKDYIEVEITETLGDYESSTIAEIGAGIKSAGFRLALDDFGSHYTNMAMLSVVPADVLKLDRSLIRDVMYSRSNQLVLKSIISLCRELGISSIAEGVETKEQLELLRSLGCDSIQGFLFGHPTTVRDFEIRYL